MYENIIGGIITIVGTLLGIYLKDYLGRKERKLDLKSDYDLKTKISPILEEIRFELRANRVQYWVFSNGDVTLTGHHLKKMSMFDETNCEDSNSISHLFQLVPTKNFDRMLSDLYTSEDGYSISHESRNDDELSDLYKMYDAKTILNIKLLTPNGKWVGILSIWYNEETDISPEEIAFAKLQTSRISVIK